MCYRNPDYRTLIVFGSNGMLGRYVSNYFHKQEDYTVIDISRNEYDVLSSSVDKLDYLIKDIIINANTDNPDNIIVFNAIGVIPQKLTSDNILDYSKKYIKVNSIFPHVLAEICHNNGIKMIHPTTDCVYSGEKGNYTEFQMHDELGIYGISKSAGEPDRCCVIRCSIIGEELYPSQSPSFLEFVRMNTNGYIKGFDNHYWNGITCLQYAKVLKHIIENDMIWIGVRHILSPEIVSKYQLASMINDVYNLNINIEKHRTAVDVDKTLGTIHETSDMLNIPSLYQQILELSEFQIK